MECRQSGDQQSLARQLWRGHRAQVQLFPMQRCRFARHPLDESLQEVAQGHFSPVVVSHEASLIWLCNSLTQLDSAICHGLVSAQPLRIGNWQQDLRCHNRDNEDRFHFFRRCRLQYFLQPRLKVLPISLV